MVVETTEITKITATIFVKHDTLSKYMTAMDLGDGGFKVFGAMADLTFSTKSTVDETYYKNMIKHLLQASMIMYVRMDRYFGFKDNILSLSTGTKFMWVQDIRKSLLSEGYEEVKW